MLLFAVDLDNTLLFSYKKYANGICVERKNDKALSYMTPKSYDLLKEVAQKVWLMPITTRSLAQYQRITLFDTQAPPIALCANGAICLKNGAIDESWQQETEALIAPSGDELEKALYLLTHDQAITLQPSFIDSAFVYAKSQNIALSLKRLQEQLDLTKVSLQTNGEKLYILPKNLTKGNALKRLCAQYQPQKIIAAGDSEFDLSMLLLADTAIIAPNERLISALSDHRKLWIGTTPDETFGEFVLEKVLAESQ